MVRENKETDNVLKVGARLKHARLMMGLSLAELGKRTSLTEGYLSKLENNRSQASMATLHRLAAVLGINMSQLFASGADDGSPILVTRSQSRPQLSIGNRRGGNQVVLERLVPGSAGQLLQVNIHRIGPGGGSPDPINHDGQEFGFLLNGSLELTVRDSVISLSAGDCFYFDSTLPHSYRNIGADEAQVLWVNTPPTF